MFRGRGRKGRGSVTILELEGGVLLKGRKKGKTVGFAGLFRHGGKSNHDFISRTMGTQVEASDTGLSKTMHHYTASRKRAYPKTRQKRLLTP